MKTQWEYLITVNAPDNFVDFDEWLNRLGEEGWELCGIYKNQNKYQHRFIFKMERTHSVKITKHEKNNI